MKMPANFRKYLANTSWLMMDKVLRLFLGVFVGAWVARYLGPENYGILGFAVSFVGLFGAFGKLGLDGIIVRNIVNEPDQRDEILGTALGLRLIGASVLIVFVYAALQLTSSSAYEQVIVMIIALGQLFMGGEVFNLYFQSQVKAKYSGITGTLVLLSNLGIRIAFILLGLPLIWFAGVVIVEQVMKSCLLVYFYKKQKLKLLQLRFRLLVGKALLSDSWPLILSGLVVMVYMRIDQVMIKEMLDNEAVGQYAAAVKLSEAWYFIPIVIAQSLFPAIIKAKKRSEKLYHERLQKFYDLMVWVAAAIALPTTFLCNWLVNLLYGAQYSRTAGVLMIHIWAGVFVFLGVASGRWFLAENLQKYSFYRTAAGAVINIVLNYILIPIHGIYGAAYATVITQAIASYLFNMTNNKLRYTFLLQTNAILFPFRKLGVKFG